MIRVGRSAPALAMGVALVCLAWPAMAFAQVSGCGSSATAITSDAASPLPVTDQSLFVLDSQGHLHRAGFDQRAWKQISTADFSPQHVSLKRSADSRYAILYGRSATSPQLQYWLYDTKSERNLRILVRPEWGHADPVFSPDGKYVAIFSRDDTRNASHKGVGLYLIETASGRPSFLGPPADSQLPATDVNVSSWWRSDGNAVLLAFRGASIDEYYEVPVASGRYGRIGGRPPSDGQPFRFFRDVSEIPVADKVRTQYSARPHHSASPDARLQADIDAQGVLRMVVPGKPARVVATGAYNECEGQTIGILGWVEGHRYLIFINAGVSYVYNTASGTTTPLFRNGEEVQNFFW
jgi:dipeptidyl aminopeptidase/acylaminoacyl peptidase